MEFLKEAKVWFVGTLIGTLFSGVGLFVESKIPSLVGLVVTSVATMYYAYQCWKASQWEEFNLNNSLFVDALSQVLK